MSNNQNQQAKAQTTSNRSVTVSATRKAGVPSREQVYEILKARSLQLQSGQVSDQ
ncbi:hypothetical protein LCGC14_1204910 [marine sediment metagenome]|uniref:Uncharacterized protein n=1 Tax=marine sediment metagenome TaxID=412755 RepID=A0A0F9LK91_9ZZZZ